LYRAIGNQRGRTGDGVSAGALLRRLHPRPTATFESDRARNQRAGGENGRALPAVLDRGPAKSRARQQRAGRSRLSHGCTEDQDLRAGIDAKIAMGASHARESGVHHGRGPFPPKRASKACSVDAGDLPLTLKAQLTLSPLAPGAHLAPLGAGAFGLLECFETRLPMGLLQFQLRNVQPELGSTGLLGQLAINARRWCSLPRLPPEHGEPLT